MFYQRMLAEKESLEAKAKHILAILKTLPKDNFFCTKNGNHYKWYRTDGKKHTYIPKRDRDIAVQLAAKKYYSLLLDDTLHEKKAIEFYLRHHKPQDSEAEHLLTKSPEYQELLSSYFKPLSLELQEWMESPFAKNPKYPEQLTNKTIAGTYVRSKSEFLIDLFLRKYKIPFRYEAELALGNISFYPDFTIRHPKTGTYFYWEHFGLMDDPNYCQNAISKLKLYTSHGYIPSINLITTYETSGTPLSAEMVEKTIQYYFQ